MKTMLKLGTTVAVAGAAFLVITNPGGIVREQERNCGAGIRPRAVTVTLLWQPKEGQERSYVRINGNIGPATINEPRTASSPARYKGQACPGETASINGVPLAGPLPQVICNISVGGSNLTGDSIERITVRGGRAFCKAVIK